MPFGVMSSFIKLIIGKFIYFILFFSPSNNRRFEVSGYIMISNFVGKILTSEDSVKSLSLLFLVWKITGF